MYEQNKLLNTILGNQRKCPKCGGPGKYIPCFGDPGYIIECEQKCHTWTLWDWKIHISKQEEKTP